MQNYEICFTKEAVKDIKKLSKHLKEKLKYIIENIIINNPTHGKKLVGDLEGFFSYRLSYKDRIIYSVENNLITVHRARTHYGE